MKYDAYRVKSVEKSMLMMKLFTVKQPELSLGQLSQSLKVHKSTAYRIAVTLAEGGFLRWNPHKGTYSLGLRILELGSVLMNTLELRSQARPHLEKLHRETGETIHLAVLEQGEVVYVDKLEGERGIRLYSEVGKRAPCHCTALGKALLADAPESKVRRILEEKGMKCYTNKTFTSIPLFLKHLEQVRRDGYAVDAEEHEPLVHCVAVPIFDYTGKTIAAVSNTLIIKNFEEDVLSEYIALVREAGRNISFDMGKVDSLRCAADMR